MGAAPLGLCAETGNLRGKRRKRVGPSCGEQRRRGRVGSGGRVGPVAPQTWACAARASRLRAWGRRCKRRAEGAERSLPCSSKQNSGGNDWARVSTGCSRRRGGQRKRRRP